MADTPEELMGLLLEAKVLHDVEVENLKRQTQAQLDQLARMGELDEEPEQISVLDMVDLWLPGGFK